MELDLLPDHVLIEIFRSLNTHDLVNYRRVSKRWFRLISCPQYFQRAHHLCFAGCTLSATCPPLSVFKNSSQPFFRFLTIKHVEYNLDEKQEDWANNWSGLGNRFTYLNFENAYFLDLSRILGDGSNWLQLIELEVNSCVTIFPQLLKIPTLKTLKLMCGDLSQYLETNFPNLKNLHVRIMDGRHFTDWELQRLREVKCDPLNLRVLKTKTIQTLSLQNLDEINLNDKQYIESFLSKQKNLLELKIDVYGIPALEYWCNWTQLTELNITTCDLNGPPLGHYFTQLKNLKSVYISLYGCTSSCFFGHKVMDLPRLDKYSIFTPNQCEECWKSCLESFTNAKVGAIYEFAEIRKYFYLLHNLETFTSDRFHCCLNVGDGDMIIKPSRNLLKLYSRCRYRHVHEGDYRAIADCFPNLRMLEIPSFNPIILKLLPELQALDLYANNDCSQDMIEGLVQYGKNLRIIKIYDCCTEEHAKYLFDKLELLVQVTASYYNKVYTRSSFECQKNFL